MRKIAEISAKNEIQNEISGYKWHSVGNIRPEGPLNSQETSCKILWSHLKNSWKKIQKNITPKNPSFWGEGEGGWEEPDLKWTKLDNIDVVCRAYDGTNTEITLHDAYPCF